MKRISPYSQQKTTYIIIITILLAFSLIMMLFGCGKRNGIDDQGPSEQTAASSGVIISPKNDIYFAGKDVIITRTALEEAKDFYLQAGYSEEEAFDQAVLYVQTYETMYFLATKAGYQATEKEIEDRIEMLGGSTPTIEKDIAIEKYREAEIKPEFDKIATHEPGSEEYWTEWAAWYEEYQLEKVEEQGFQLVVDSEE